MKLRKIITMRQALADQKYFGVLLAGDSWAAWRVLLIAIVGEELTEDERVIFKALTGRDREPGEACSELWCRRGGKSRAAGVLAAYLARYPRLAAFSDSRGRRFLAASRRGA